MNKSIPLILLFLSILNASCTKVVKYTKEELYLKARAGDPEFELLLPKSISEGVHCSDYSDGCLSAHMVRARNLDFIAVEFQTEAQAIYAAKKFRGYYVRNWFFDDVRREPVLEKFVTEHLEAKIP